MLSFNQLIQNIETFIGLESWDLAKKSEEAVNNYLEEYIGWWSKVRVETRSFTTNNMAQETKRNYEISYRLADEKNKVLIKFIFEEFKSRCKESEEKLDQEKTGDRKCIIL